MPSKHRIVADPTLTRVVRRIVRELGLTYIDTRRVAVVRNLDSRSSAYARIYCVPRPISIAFGIGPLYAIEIIDRNFRSLDCESKISVLVHELLHIPKSFSGGLVPHRSSIFSSTNIARLVKSLDLEELCKELEYK
ncbi:MAG: metallopeptidase [Crenarchaeota archaeon]|nr:metallopeptidase [Thermoproteota archaeon]